MFKNILIPISSEVYSRQVLERAIFLADKFKSKLTLFYIIENRTLEQVEKKSDMYRTEHDRLVIKKDVMNIHKKTVDNIILDDAKTLLESKDISFVEKTLRGEFGEVIKSEASSKKYDLILMGYGKGCNLDYSFFYEIDVPLWIESNLKSKSILAVCSNLAPNKIVPKISIKLANKLGWELKMLYVTDTQDSVEVDEKGERSSRKEQRDLAFIGQKFVKKMQDKKMDIRIVKGNLEREIQKEAKNEQIGLVIIGRERKEKGPLGLPAGNVKQKIAQKCKYSVLFIN